MIQFAFFVQVLGASTSDYYAYLKKLKSQVSIEDRKLLTKIKSAYTPHKGTYGAKRIAKYLSSKGKLVNHKRVARIMREANLKATVRRPKTTKGKAAGHVYENLLNRLPIHSSKSKMGHGYDQSMGGESEVLYFSVGGFI
ncbi:MAG: IS3 family transposase [Bacillus sp. (in: firmicutes)]